MNRNTLLTLPIVAVFMAGGCVPNSQTPVATPAVNVNVEVPPLEQGGNVQLLREIQNGGSGTIHLDLSLIHI